MSTASPGAKRQSRGTDATGSRFSALAHVTACARMGAPATIRSEIASGFTLTVYAVLKQRYGPPHMRSLRVFKIEIRSTMLRDLFLPAVIEPRGARAVMAPAQAALRDVLVADDKPGQLGYRGESVTTKHAKISKSRSDVAPRRGKSGMANFENKVAGSSPAPPTTPTQVRQAFHRLAPRGYPTIRDRRILIP